MDIGHDKVGRPFPHPDGAVGMARADDQARDQPSDSSERQPDTAAPETTEPSPATPLQAVPPPDPGTSDSPRAASPSSSPASASSSASALLPPGEGESGGSVDKIRDIIFGVQMRDYDSRFAGLEDRLLKESGALRDDANRRFDALEALVKQQVEALGERLAREAASRAHAVQELAQRISDLVQHVEARTRQIDDQAAQNQRELQQQLREQGETLTTEITSRFDALSATLDRQTGALRDEKTDRASLASMLTDLARRLHPESGAGDESGPGGSTR